MAERYTWARGAKSKVWQPSEEDWFAIYQSLFLKARYFFKELNSDEAEDLASEGFKLGWSRFSEKFKPPSGSDEIKLASLKQWCSRIMINHQLDKYRKNKKEREYQEALVRSQESDLLKFGPESNIDNSKILNNMIDEIKTRLPPEKYDVYYKKEILGYTFVEIAEELQSKRSTVDTRYYSAIVQIDDIIEKYKDAFAKDEKND